MNRVQSSKEKAILWITLSRIDHDEVMHSVCVGCA